MLEGRRVTRSVGEFPLRRHLEGRVSAAHPSSWPRGSTEGQKPFTPGQDVLRSGAVHCGVGPRSGTRTSRFGWLWFCHVELQCKKMEPETHWAAVRIQVGGDGALSGERRTRDETISGEAAGRWYACLDVGGAQWDSKGGWFLAEVPDRWDRGGEVTDRTESGWGNLVGLALSVSEAQTRLLVSKSSFNLGSAEKVCLPQGLSGELGRAACHRGRPRCRSIRVTQGCSKGAKRCCQVETGVPLGTQGKPQESMGVDKEMYRQGVQGRPPGGGDPTPAAQCGWVCKGWQGRKRNSCRRNVVLKESVCRGGKPIRCPSCPAL